MNFIVTVFNWFMTNIWKQTAIFLGIISFIGLRAQKKSAEETIEGTLLTVVGYYAFGAGTSLITGAIGKINDVLMPTLSTQFGVYPYTTPVVNTCYSIEYLSGHVMTLFIISWIIHVLVVRIFSKWFKCVYLTVVHALNATCVSMLFWYCCMGFEGMALYIAVIICNVLYFTLSPMAVYKDTQELTDGAFALGHTQQFGAYVGGKLAGLIGNPEESADNIQLPGWLSIFSQTTLSLAVSMPLTFILCIAIALIVGNAQAMEVLTGYLGGTNWIIWCFIQGTTFAAGTAVLMYGLRTFLGALVPAFKGFSEKVMPGCVPAIDCAAFYGYSQMGVVLGFVGYVIGGFIVSGLCLLLKTSVFVFPSISTSFFDGACVGVFANKHGGWKGCLISCIVMGFLMHAGSGLLATGLLGVENAAAGFSPGNWDFTCVYAPIFWLISLFK